MVVNTEIVQHAVTGVATVSLLGLIILIPFSFKANARLANMSNFHHPFECFDKAGIVSHI
jgi:hypothetical protein